MLTVTDASEHPQESSEMISQYRSENGLGESEINLENVLLALDDDTPKGFICLRNGRIESLYVQDEDDEVRERLLRAAVSMSMIKGRESISIHSVDLRGRTERICRHMGFTEDGMCTCSQRDGTVCLRLNF